MQSDTWLTSIDERLAQQLQFLLEIDRLKKVVRGSRITDASRKENTAEHSWHIAVFATVLSEWAIGDVSVPRVVEMLLIHDLVEIDAGDTPLFEQMPSEGHVELERIAADRIFNLLPDDQSAQFRALWEEFEAAESSDARFAKAIDRLQPILLNHVVGGGTWTDYDVDEQRERSLTKRIADGSPALWQAAEVVFSDAVKQGWLKPANDGDDR